MNKIRGLYIYFGIAVLLLWLKSYMAFRFEFSLDIENSIQEIILMITPLSSVLFILGFGLLLRGKNAYRYIWMANIFLTLILWGNLLFYRFFNDFVTLPVLFQTKNAGDLGGSAFALMKLHDVLYFIDIVLLMLYAKRQKKFGYEKINYKKSVIGVITTTLIGICFINLSLAEKERPELLTRTFDRQILVKLLGLYNYQVYDVFLHTKSNAQRAMADSNDLVQIVNYANTKQKEPNEEMFGVAKGKNLILISFESTQNFIVDYKLNGQEVTPFLNKLAKESYYFNNFYHQTGQGKTSDSEFILENSYYGLPRGAVFTQKSQNTYDGMAKILTENHYETAVFHGNNASFWNRDVIYPKLGYQKFFDEKYFNITEDNSVGYGLEDKPFFEQSIPLMKTLKQPYYAKFITLTNHYPYEMREENISIEPHTTGDKSVDRYFQTMKYADESLELFFNQLKEEGMYENSIFVIFGDHYGISKNHNKAMEQVIGKEINDYETAELQKVPLIVHIPGHKGKTITQISGQVDLKPTIMNLLGMETRGHLMFGQDLFAKERDQFIVFRDGSVITDKYIYTENTCYQKADGLEVDEKECQEIKNKGERELEFSDKLVYGDLLRFEKNGNLSEEELKIIEEEIEKMREDIKKEDEEKEEDLMKEEEAEITAP